MAEYNCSCRGVERIYDWGGRLCKIMNGGGGGGGGGGVQSLTTGGGAYASELCEHTNGMAVS